MTSTAEAEVITGPPNTRLTSVEKVHKDTRDDTQLVAREAKQDMANQERRRQRRCTKEKRLKPRQNADGERTVKKQMLQRLTGSRTKARQRNIVTKRGQAFGSIENPWATFQERSITGRSRSKRKS